MKYLVLGDLHWASDARRPRSRVVGYPEALRTKLRSAWAYGDRRGADRVVFTGDLFHHKDPTVPEIRDLARVLRECRLSSPGALRAKPPLVVRGNHDGTGLDCLLAAGALVELGPDGVADAPDLVGRPYRATGDGERDSWDVTWADGARVIVSHAMVLETRLPVSDPSGYVLADTLAGWVPKSVVVLNGHVHGPFKVRGVTSVGSVGRTARDQLHDPRAILVEIPETGTPRLTGFKLPSPLVIFEPETQDPVIQEERAIQEAALALVDERVDGVGDLDRLVDLAAPPGSTRDEARRYIDGARRRLG